MSRLRAQEGMTLTELLIALTVAMVISLATFTLIGVTITRSGDVSARVDTTQRGRSAMDFVTRQMRSQVCVQLTGAATESERTVYAATPLSVTFFSDFSDESFRTGNVPRAPELRTLSFESGKLMERAWTGLLGGTAAAPTYAYAGFPAITSSRQRQVLDDAATTETTDNLVGGPPLVFRYYKFSSTVPPQPNVEMPSAAGLTVNELQLLARITVSFRALRSRAKAGDKTGSTAISTEVYARSADPNSTAPKPVCA